MKKSKFLWSATNVFLHTLMKIVIIFVGQGVSDPGLTVDRLAGQHFFGAQKEKNVLC